MHSCQTLHFTKSELLIDYQIQRYAGEAQRRSDLYGTKSVLNKLGSQITREFKGVENVYTQHSPLLKLTVEELLKGAWRQKI